MVWPRESEAAYLERLCRELALPDDDGGRERLKAAMDALYDRPSEWTHREHAQLRGRLIEHLVGRAVEHVRDYVDADRSPFPRSAFRAALLVVAAEDGLVTVPEPGFTMGTDSGASRRITFDHHEGPAAMDVAIWWEDKTDPVEQHGRIAVFIRHNIDRESIFGAVFDALAESGWDVRVLSGRDVEADPVGTARGLLRPVPPSLPAEPLRPYLVKGPDREA